MKKLLLSSAAALAVGVSSVALAADLPTYEAPAPIVSAPVVSTWTGFYVGLHAGWGWGDSDVDAEDIYIDGFYGYDYVDFDGGISSDGWLVGAQAGFNWQMGMLVLGLEVDASWTDIDGEENDVDVGYYGFYGDYTADFDVGVNWLASVRARAGVAFDRILLYGTGGVAFAGVESEVELFDGLGDSLGDSSDKSTEVGWVIGAGVEGMVTSNISARLEYLHYEFGDIEHSSDDLDVDYDLDVDVVRAGINWKF